MFMQRGIVVYGTCRDVHARTRFPHGAMKEMRRRGQVARNVDTRMTFPFHSVASVDRAATIG
jgi:hypothetical protein